MEVNQDGGKILRTNKRRAIEKFLFLNPELAKL